VIKPAPRDERSYRLPDVKSINYKGPSVMPADPPLVGPNHAPGLRARNVLTVVDDCQKPGVQHERA
jgi:hypothetical protein